MLAGSRRREGEGDAPVFDRDGSVGVHAPLRRGMHIELVLQEYLSAFVQQTNATLGHRAIAVVSATSIHPPSGKQHIRFVVACGIVRPEIDGTGAVDRKACGGALGLVGRGVVHDRYHAHVLVLSHDVDGVLALGAFAVVAVPMLVKGTSLMGWWMEGGGYVRPPL